MKQEIHFLNQKVVIVRRHRARRLTVTMHPDQPLKVSTNLTTSDQQILAFLNSKKIWIEKNLAQIETLTQKFKKPEIKEAELFPYLGELKYLKLITYNKKKLHFSIEDGFLICQVPIELENKPQRQDEIANQLKKFFKQKALTYLSDRFNFWQQKTGLRAQELKFRKPLKRWGSCSSQKTITLNWKLICQPVLLIDYVIIHELCHLKYMNHSNDFWSLVASFMPEFKTYEKALNEQERLGLFLN